MNIFKYTLEDITGNNISKSTDLYTAMLDAVYVGKSSICREVRGTPGNIAFEYDASTGVFSIDGLEDPIVNAIAYAIQQVKKLQDEKDELTDQIFVLKEKLENDLPKKFPEHYLDWSKGRSRGTSSISFKEFLENHGIDPFND